MNIKKFIKKYPNLFRFCKQLYRFIYKRHIYAITAPIRVLPDFIVFAADRSGTSSLFYNLQKHPCIYASDHDHLGFFDDNFHLGIQFYRSFFPTILEKKYLESKEGKCLTYDVTSSYIYNTTAAERIFHALPHVKIVVILRNPIDRAYSEYNLDRELNPHIETFETLVNKEIEEIQTNNSTTENERHTFDSNKKNYLRRGLYYDQLKHWFNLFPRENILILSTEDFATDANEVF
ncbi:MAG: sulfotransferase domain-containing protein, partial [Candidatus Nitrosotenuis sp.]